MDYHFFMKCTIEQMSKGLQGWGLYDI